MTNRSRSRSVLRAGPLLLALLVAGAAHAQAGKDVRTEGEFIAFDAARSTITVQVTDPGTGGETSLRRGDRAAFRVQPSGSVLTRTTVTIKGARGEIGKVPVGSIVHVFWRPDETAGNVRFARKVDAQ